MARWLRLLSRPIRPLVGGAPRVGVQRKAGAVFPISDEVQQGRRMAPAVTYALIGLNVLVFAYELTLSPSKLVEFVDRWGVVAADVSSGERLITLLTAMFIHAGWLHLAGNMLFLWVFGDNVEDTMGHAKFLIFYLLCGVAGSALQVALRPDSQVPMVGASGAIAGVLGAYLLLFPHGKVKTLVFLWFIPFVFLVPAWYLLGVWILMQFINGFVALQVETWETGGGTGWFAHIGGFLTGALLVNLFADKKRVERQRALREGHRAFQRVGLRE